MSLHLFQFSPISGSPDRVVEAAITVDARAILGFRQPKAQWRRIARNRDQPHATEMPHRPSSFRSNRKMGPVRPNEIAFAHIRLRTPRSAAVSAAHRVRNWAPGGA